MNNNNNDFKYEITEHIAEISKKGNYTLEINKISYSDNQPKIDIRRWNRYNNTMRKGITLTEEEFHTLLDVSIEYIKKEKPCI